MKKTFSPHPKHILSAIGLAIATLAGTALAQSAPPPDSDTTQANTGIGLDTVVVTGTSEKKRKFQTPYAISTMNAAAIQDLAPHSAVDALRAVPGVNVENSGGEGGGENVVIRGLPFSGFRLMDMQEDGLPLFESNFERQLQIDELFRVDLNTKRVELVRGGTAPIFSNNASGGVVNFITNHGTDTPLREVKLSAGSNKLKRADFEISGPATEDLLYSFSGFYRQSDGARNPGYANANDGGQIKIGGTYRGENGTIFADLKLLNDKAAFYSAIPLIDTRNGNSLSGLISPSTGTLLSNSYRNVSFLAGNGAGGVQTINQDLADGIHPNIQSLTMGGDFDLSNGWSLSDKARYSTGSVLFNTILNGAPTDASTYLNGNRAAATKAFSGTSSLRYVTAGTNNVFNPSSTAGLVMVNTWSSTQSDITYFVNDLRLNKVFNDAQWGKHELTFGLSLSRFDLAQAQLGNGLLTSVQNSPNALDIQALDASGNVLGTVTQNGFAQYGSGDLIGNVKGTAIAPYFTENWWITKDWQADIGVRAETRKEDGNRGVIGAITNAGSGPIAARSVNGLTGYVPYSQSLSGTAWTIGTSNQFSPTLNGFARYTSAYSLPRLSDAWTNINNGVAGTLPDGSPVPTTKIHQSEIGVKTRQGPVELAAIGFWSKFEKLNSSTYVADAKGILSSQPLLINTTTVGLEFEGAWHASKHFDLGGSLTLQSPKIDSATTFNSAYSGSNLNDKVIPRVPQTTLTLQPAYVFEGGAGPARVYANINTVSKRYQDFVNTSVLQPYTTLDVGLHLPLSKTVTLDLQGTNLTDSTGLTEGNARAPANNTLVEADATTGRPIFGRAFTMSLTAKF